MSEKCLMIVTGVNSLTGGIARTNRLARRALVDRSYQVDVLALNESKESLAESPLPVGDYLRFGGGKIAFTRSAWAKLLSAQYKVILCDHINLAAMLAPLSRLGRCQYAAWLFGLEVFPPRPDFEGRLGMLNASRCLAISEFTRASVINRYPTLEVSVCELALDPGLYGESLPDRPVSGKQGVCLPAVDGSTQQLGEQVILWVGRLDSGSRHKGQQLLLDAFVKITPAFPSAQLILAGGGADLPVLKSMAAGFTAEVQRSVFLPGYISDDQLRSLYESCYLFAMPSWGEGFGLVYLEAMAAAKPCLAYRQTGASSIIIDGVTGTLLDRIGSTAELAEEIMHLLGNPELAIAMGRAGYDRVRSRYCYPHFRNRFYTAMALDG